MTLEIHGSVSPSPELRHYHTKKQKSRDTVADQGGFSLINASLRSSGIDPKHLTSDARKFGADLLAMSPKEG